MNTRAACLVTLLSLCACSESTPEPSGPSCEPAPSVDFEVGTGESCYQPLADGDAVYIIGGPQGGFHIWLGFACEACEGDTLLSYGLRDVDGNWIYGAGPQQEMIPVEEAQAAGVIALVSDFFPDGASDEGVDPSSYIGSDVTLFASVDTGTALYEDEVTVEVIGIEYQQSSCPECN